MSLGANIIRLRKQRGWKQKDLAEKLGVHVRNLVRWEHDEARPRAQALQRIAEVLEVSLEELQGEEPAPHWALAVQDKEWQELLAQFGYLDPQQRDTLKSVFVDMLTRRRMEAALRTGGSGG